MLKAGLTGSIAVGKSSVCGVFEEFGCHVLDADKTARDVVRAGTPGLREIVEYFGDTILLDNGEMDRAKMGSLVFADEEKRLKLNSIVHPYVFKEQEKWLAERETEDPNGIAIIDAALMIESGGYKRFDGIIVVWCEPAIQLERLMKRNKLSAKDAKMRIDAQMPQEEKKKYADILIDTSGSFEDSREATRQAFLKLKAGKM